MSTPPPPPPVSDDIDLAPIEDLRAFVNYVRQMFHQGSILQVDAQTALWVLEKLEEHPTSGVDTLLAVQPQLQERINGLTGIYQGKAKLAEEELGEAATDLFKVHASDETIKGQGRISLINNLVQTDPRWRALNQRHAKLSAAATFFQQLGFALNNRKDILVQISKNSRED